MIHRMRFFRIFAIVTQFLTEREPKVFQDNRKLPHSLNHENEKAVSSHPIQGREQDGWGLNNFEFSREFDNKQAAQQNKQPTQQNKQLPYLER